MSLSKGLVRILFFMMSVAVLLAFFAETAPQPDIWTYLKGVGLGSIMGILLCSFDFLLKRFSLRTFNAVTLGLFFGYLMALALNLIFTSILKAIHIETSLAFVEFLRIFLFLAATYLGVMIITRSSEEISFCIPFIKLIPAAQQIKETLVDLSALSDPRMIDLAASGLLDKRLLLPRFLLKEIHRQEEQEDELTSLKAKRTLEVIKKLEILPHLHLRFQETDFPDVKDVTHKVLLLARLLDADVLSADINRIQMAQTEGVRVINLHALSNALKPLMQRGESLKIKIQRYGKAEQQGVGYLEDGTMVVVNGGGDYLGETIDASVLSVKHTASGRMVFCNMTAEKEKSSYDEEDY